MPESFRSPISACGFPGGLCQYVRARCWGSPGRSTCFHSRPVKAPGAARRDSLHAPHCLHHLQEATPSWRAQAFRVLALPCLSPGRDSFVSSGSRTRVPGEAPGSTRAAPSPGHPGGLCVSGTENRGAPLEQCGLGKMHPFPYLSRRALSLETVEKASGGGSGKWSPGTWWSAMWTDGFSDNLSISRSRGCQRPSSTVSAGASGP